MNSIPKEHQSSPDLIKQNIETLKKLFPEIVTEGKVDFTALRDLLEPELDEREERYQFTWNGKSKARRLATQPSTGTLRPCPEESVDWDTTQNLFLEGDNLEVLKLLQRSYSNKIKMIYIDPPYNTGKDFIYPDNYRDNIGNYLDITGQKNEEGHKVSSNTETSGRYHSNWLNMMYPRLKLARELLSQVGVIFISIDDTEVANMRKMCDEIFGEENFVANVIWQKKFSRSNDASYFSTMHDHILCYAKQTKLNHDGPAWELKLLPRKDTVPDGYTNPDKDPRGPWTSVVLSTKSGSEKLIYQITTPSGRKCYPPDGRFWGVNESKFEELVTDNRIWFGKEGSGIPRLKTFLSEVQSGLRPNTIWFHKEVGHNQEGRQELKSLFDDKGFFDSPKPVRLLSRVLEISDLHPNDIVLDFFAGSSTTAHAVMQYHCINKSNLRFINIQLPELCAPTTEAYKAGYNTISEIGKERIRRVVKNLKTNNPNYKGDLGFKVFKLDSSNIKPWDNQADNVQLALEDMVQNIKSDRSELDVVYEVLLKYGLDLAIPIEKRQLEGEDVYVAGAGALIFCLSETITIPIVEAIAALKGELSPEFMRVVFRDSGFASSVEKTNAHQILLQHGIDDIRSI